MRGVAVAIILCVFASPVLSQSKTDPCSALTQYMDGARSGFQALRGQDDGTGDWEAKVYLPQANSCKIRAHGSGGYSATCNYIFIDTDDRTTGLRQMQRAIESCLGWPAGGFRQSRAMMYKGVTGYEIEFIPLGKFDAQLAIEYVGPR